MLEMLVDKERFPALADVSELHAANVRLLVSPAASFSVIADPEGQARLGKDELLDDSRISLVDVVELSGDLVG